MTVFSFDEFDALEAIAGVGDSGLTPM